MWQSPGFKLHVKVPLSNYSLDSPLQVPFQTWNKDSCESTPFKLQLGNSSASALSDLKYIHMAIAHGIWPSSMLLKFYLTCYLTGTKQDCNFADKTWSMSWESVLKWRASGQLRYHISEKNLHSILHEAWPQVREVFGNVQKSVGLHKTFTSTPFDITPFRDIHIWGKWTECTEKSMAQKTNVTVFAPPSSHMNKPVHRSTRNQLEDGFSFADEHKYIYWNIDSYAW